MFAGFGGTNDIFCMHRRWQDYIDHIDVGIVGDRIEILVVIDILIRYVEVLFPLLSFRWSPCNYPRQITLRGELQRRCEKVLAIVAKSYQRNSKPFLFLWDNDLRKSTCA